MIRASANPDLLTLLYRSAIDDQYLSQFLAMCAKLTDCHNVALLVHDLVNPDRSLLVTNPAGAESSEYYTRNAEDNPYIETARSYIRKGTILRVNTLLSDRRIKKSSFYTDFCRPTDIYQTMGATLHADNRSIVALTFNRQESAPFLLEHEQWLGELLPHLQTWLEIRKRVSELDLSRQAAWETLNLQEQGVIILNQHLLPIFTNHAAQNIVMDSKVLTWRGGHFATNRADLSNWLSHTIAKVFDVSSGPGHGGAMHIEDETESLDLMVAPLFCNSIFGEELLCAIFISNRNSLCKSLHYYLCEVYGLTARESEIACLLIQGLGLRDIAESCEVKHSTVRTHVKRIFLKTGVNRQSELVRAGLSVNFALPGEVRYRRKQ